MNWSYSEGKPPTYWFGDKVYHTKQRSLGVIQGMRWSDYKEPHQWVYIVRFLNRKSKKSFLAYGENLEPR